MAKVVSVVGARPQFIKAAVVSQVLREVVEEVLVHTGQHYDENMSRVFFDELGLPRPDEDLGVGSGTHAWQTGMMLERVEKVLEAQAPDLVLVYGDTNSTLAGALAAVKLGIPVGHVEAGLRSFNRAMPEEINRIVADRCSDVLFCPTETAVENLKREGIVDGLFQTGDVMYDAALRFGRIAEQRSTIVLDLGLEPGGYCLVTVHRVNSMDCRDHLEGIVRALVETRQEIVFPVYPRTRGFLEGYDLLEALEQSEHVHLVDPVGYLDMVQLERNARKILTDSGGVQKEAYFYRVPCITLRDETEWVETVEEGWNVLVGTETERILQALRTFVPVTEQRSLFGDGHAGEKIRDEILAYIQGC